MQPTDVEPAGAAGSRIGPYRLVRLLGEGGMGSVWLAERTDGILQRPVALKIPHYSWSRPELSQRLEREREILASLTHPRIARLYDAGVTADGQPYIAIEYVEGETITEFADARGLDIEARLRLFLQVADALAYAHSQLVIHRDIKPSNVLVTEDGDCRLLDFGIAKLLEDGDYRTSELTKVAGHPLTLAYASPEQVSFATVGVASDIYSLGVLLYRLLVSASPYKLPRDSGAALEEAILHGDPVKPSDQVTGRARRTLRGDVDTIVLKALKKEPAARYATVNAFADDVERYLHGLPVRARPDSVGYRLRKLIGRHRVAFTAAVLIAISTIGGAAVAIHQARVAVAEKRRAVAAQQRAEEIKEFVASIFRDASPYATGGEKLSAIGLLEQAEVKLARSFGTRPELRAELYDLIGNGMIVLEDSHGAARVLERAIAELEPSLGAEHPRVLKLQVLLAEAQRFTGLVDEAAETLEEIRARLDPASAPLELLLEVENAAAHLAIDQGRYAEANQASERYQALATRVVEDRELILFEAAFLRAVTLQFDSPAEKALEAAERAEQLAQRLYADQPRHPRRIECRALYGRALRKLGHQREAAEQIEASVADASAVFGPDSMMVGFFSDDLADLYIALGELDRALERSETALRVLGDLYDADSAVVAMMELRRGAALLAARRAASALPDLESAVTKLEAAMGSEHPRVTNARAHHALALAYLGRVNDAAATLASQVGAETEPAPHAAHVHGVIMRLSNRSDDALAWQQRALAAAAEDPRAAGLRAAIAVEIGLAHLDAGDRESAERWLTRAVAEYDALAMPPTPSRIDAEVGLARLALDRDDLDRACPLLERADAYWRARGPDSRWASDVASLRRGCR